MMIDGNFLWRMMRGERKATSIDRIMVAAAVASFVVIDILEAENKYFDTFEVVPEHPELGTSIVMGEDKVWTRITE